MPDLSDELYFSLDGEELDIVNSHRSAASKLFFIIQLGHFKAKKLFFTAPHDKIKEDLHFIARRYSNPAFLPDNPEINRGTRWKQEQRILQLFGYHQCDTFRRTNLQGKAAQSIRLSSKPICIFKDLLGYLEKSKVVLPAYSTMQDIVSRAIMQENARLSVLAEEHITVRAHFI